MNKGSQPPSGIFRLLAMKKARSLIANGAEQADHQQPGGQRHCLPATMPALKVSITMTPVTAMP